MKTKIYLAYHAWAPRISGGVSVPIQVGRAIAKDIIPDMIGDDTGDHISEQNSAWCELTALYWAWKNDQTSERIGLMHYRRVLDFEGRGQSGKVETLVDHFNTDDWTQQTTEWLSSAGAEFDLIVPRLHKMGLSVEANYRRSHHAQDWEEMRRVVMRDFPTYASDFEDVAASRCMRLCNLAVMARPIFERYCAFVFGVLEQVQAVSLERCNYTSRQSRYLGFLAERLLTIFVAHECRTNSDLRLKEVGILRIDRGLVTPYFAVPDCPQDDTVNIALSVDRTYLPHAATMVRSLLDHADPARHLNLFLLHSDINEKDLDVMAAMLIRARGRLTFHLINTGAVFAKSYRSASRRPPNATYNRFLLFSLLPGVARVLYLDADMIIQRDICPLFDTPMGTAKIGAVTDWIMTRTLSGATPTADPKVPDLRAYHHDTLGLKDHHIARYFNAGVLLFNFAAMADPTEVGRELIQEAHNGQFMFRDQDILNRAFKDDVLDLDPRWNVFNSGDALYACVPARLWSRAQAARRDPWIIHFADRDYKPWGAKPVPYADAYWETAVRTPFFQEVVTQSRPRRGRALRDIGFDGAKKAVARFPVLRRPLTLLYAAVRRGR